MMMKIVLLLFVVGTLADLPNHCLITQVAGNWTFYLGPNDNTKDVVCSKSYKVATTLSLLLDLPNVAVDTKTNQQGTWTMIYDEGFEVRIGGKKYFAFSYYKTDPSDSTTSYCHKTFNGWYHNDDVTAWGCYKGVRAGPPQLSVGQHVIEHVVSPTPVHTPSVQPVAAPPTVPATTAPTPSAPAVLAANEGYKPSDDDATETEIEIETETTNLLGMEDIPYTPEHEYVNAINNIQDSYVARTYDHYNEMSIQEMVRMAGGQKAKAQIPFDELMAAQAPQRDETVDTSYLQIEEEDLPKSLDWRNKDGINYLFPVVNQGACGSCYAIATTEMIQVRLAIATQNAVRAPLSAQDILSCAEYAQGCDGGFPYLAGKYAQDFGLTTNECFPYTGQTSTCPKTTPCYEDSRVYVSDYHYIGGFYGGCNAVDMMKNIMKHGPLVVGFEVSMGLMHYGSGVFLDIETEEEISAPLPKHVNPWTKTNHAVLVVGWGETSKGMPYWIVKNSWGPTWGDKGYFHIKRGVNLMAFESMAVSAVPRVVDLKTADVEEEVDVAALLS